MPLPPTSALDHPNSGNVQEWGCHPHFPLLECNTPIMGTQSDFRGNFLSSILKLQISRSLEQEKGGVSER